MALSIGLLAFPHVQQLDLTGPYEVFASLPQTRVDLIARTLEPVTSATGLVLTPSLTFAECPPLDVLCVPGGVGVNALLEDEETLGFVRRQAATARFVTSVCTGALVLGSAGLLRGRRATTHWSVLDLLAAYGAEPVRERVVRDGNLLTGGGVTAGIDLALTLAIELFGQDTAEAVQLGLEYDPSPPANAGSPEKAPPAVLARVRAQLADLRAEREVLVARSARTLRSAPPAAKREPRRLEQLGRTRTDEYAWMRDDNWQLVLRDPSVLRHDVRAHLLAENAYTQEMLRETEALQAQIVAEMRGRIREDDSSVPLPDGGFQYYVRYAQGAQQPVHARRPRGGSGGEEVLLDCETMARDSAYYRLGGAHHSHDHSLYAWAEDRQGSEVYRLHVRRIGGDLIGDPIDSTTGNFTFSPDDRFIFWTFRDENGRPAKVFRRSLGSGEDVLVHHERDEGMFVGVELTSSRAFVMITCGNQETSEAWLVPGDDPEAFARVVALREQGVRYEVEHWDGRFVIRTNADDAIDFKLVEAPEHDPSRGHWRDWRAHVPGRFITGMAAFAEHFVRVERVDALDRIVITERATGEERQVRADEEAYSLAIGGSHEFVTTTLRYHYESPTQPRQTYDLDMRTGERSLRKTQEVPSGHDPSAYVVRRLQATAPDGTEVPITLLARRDALERGVCPTLLYGYGSYGIPMMPRFSTGTLSLVDRGWIWATAHVRGGSEKGWRWFLDGRREKKTNSFSDFIACAEHLIAAGHAEARRIVAHGGSAGGLLMGAVLNMRPDLWAGVAASVPFVDVLNTMSDASLPLTPPEWPEWGNPLVDAEAYDRIASWSPYDQVRATAYPPVLALGGLSDPRVTYWEPAKWVARLRAGTTGDAPILLRINMEAGHGGASGRFDHLKEPALVQAFAIWAEALRS